MTKKINLLYVRLIWLGDLVLIVKVLLFFHVQHRYCEAFRSTSSSPEHGNKQSQKAIGKQCKT